MEYKTWQRDTIDTLISQIGERHFTADEIYLLLSREERKVGKTTIYRYLERLVSEGRLKRFRHEDGVSAYYQVVGDGCDEHFHLKCITCGRVIHLECSHLAELNSHIAEEHNFMVDSSKVILYGCCVNCMKKEEEEAE